MKKALFLTNKSSLFSEITGGVQLCSQEFLEILNNVEGVEVENYYVNFTSNYIQRSLMKFGFENYSMYDVQKDEHDLIRYIQENRISIVFINMASLVRYSLPIKKTFRQEVNVIMMSHGNHSGDFIHLISKPIYQTNFIKTFLNKIRLGFLMSTESIFRVKYLDAVIALSETEMQIENWLGATKCIFLPRRLKENFLDYKPIIGRVGFVGRLDHPPNLQGMELLLNAFKNECKSNVEFRLVGTPEKFGKQIAAIHSSVIYLGELSDKDLEKEVATWALQLNPVWWYSTGASTKLAKAISWGVPIVTTTAGKRGYKWKNGSLLIADTPELMSKIIFEESLDINRIHKNSAETKKVAKSGFTQKELGEMIQDIL